MRQATLPPEAIAHRGIRDRYPENSLPAFQAAVDEGVDGVELDVHATADGVVVVHHDPVLPRDSSSLLAGRSIAALDYTTLSTFELAPGIQLPTLEDVLQAIAQRARLYIEIKAQNIESLVADLVTRQPTGSERCAIHSFDHRIVARFHELAPEIRSGILLVGYPVKARSLLAAAHATDLWQACEFIDHDLVSDIHGVGGRIIAWTCDDTAEWTRLRNLGVDGICTDRSAALVASLRE